MHQQYTINNNKKKKVNSQCWPWQNEAINIESFFSFCSLTWPNMAIVNLFHISNKETKPNPSLHILEAKFL